MTTDLITVDPKEFGIENERASELIGNLPQLQEERKILEQQYNEVILLDIEEASTSKRARELRLMIRDNRTKGIDVWHRTTKDFFLKGGQFVDAIKRKEVAVNERMEENLSKIENHFAIKEAERKAKLNAERISLLEPYNAFVPVGMNFGEISEEEFTKIFNGAKLQFEHQQEEERKAEAERIEKLRLENLHRERREKILPFWEHTEDKSAVYDLSVLSEEDFDNLLQRSIKRKSDYEAEQERIRKENKKLEKEKADLEAKAEKERKAAAEKLAKERAEQQAKLKAEQDEKARLEAELQAKKDAEAKAEKERLAEQERLKKEAEKLAKAPIKKQMCVWVSSFEIPTTEINNDKVESIKSKFEAFKKWALQEVEQL